MSDDRTAERERMVETQLRHRGIRNPRVLRALETVPRHEFVPKELRRKAYADGPLGIGCGQTVSQPLMVATMSDALDPQPGDRVLEVGVGSGYQTAVLLELGAHVTGIERHGRLARDAERRLRKLGYTDFEVHVGDGSVGYPDGAPFDGILVAAAAPDVPAPLIDQLAPGGRLVLPVGDRRVQSLVCIERLEDGSTKRIDLGAVVFVPLIGTAGFSKP